MAGVTTGIAEAKAKFAETRRKWLARTKQRRGASTGMIRQAMRELGEASEDEVVLAFVRAEIDSPKWGRRYHNAMQAHGLDRASLIGEPSDAQANRNRRLVLGTVRGFGRDDALFRGFPLDTKWRRVSVEPSDFHRMKYIDGGDDWLKLSSGTRLVQDGAINVDSNDCIAAKVRGTQREIEQGRCTAELILVEADNDALVVVEGHTRATAYAILLDRPFAAFVGSSPDMYRWTFI